MAAEPQRPISREAFLVFERGGDVRHEYVAGELFAMAGGTENHDLINGNIFARLYLQLAGGNCRAYTSNMRVAIQSLDIYTYPDVSVVCGKPEFEDGRRDTLLNPVVLIEVLSPSTERYDRGRRFHRYQRIPSFEEYVLIAQDMPFVEHFVRQSDGRWLLATVEGLNQRIAFESIGCNLTLAEMYANVDFSSAPR